VPNAQKFRVGCDPIRKIDTAPHSRREREVEWECDGRKQDPRGGAAVCVRHRHEGPLEKKRGLVLFCAGRFTHIQVSINNLTGGLILFGHKFC